MSKTSVTFILVVFTLVAVPVSSTAQTNVSAKTSSLQPQPSNVASDTDRVRDGLSGPVRRVRTEVVKLAPLDGKLLEGKRTLVEVAAYDINGNKTQNQYFPQTGATLTGKEVYKYDDKGNISEMTLLSDDGVLLSKEVYRYEYDFAGNWNKMVTSVAAVEGGNLIFEPTEVTYRLIMYYLDENSFKAVQPGGVSAVRPDSPSSKPVGSDKSGVPPDKHLKSDKNLASSLPTATSAATDISKASAADLSETSNSEPRAPLVVLDTEPPPSSVPNPILKPVSGGVLNGRAINLPTPDYPEAAKRMRITGVVSVEVVIDEMGKVISAVAANGPPTLRDAATKAALRARFSPTKLSGQPVKVSGVINYKFSLAQ